MNLKGLNILITAGPTFEMWDDIRCLTNLSSGKIGYALARHSLNSGASTTLISSAKGHLDKPGKILKILSAMDMFDAVKKEFSLCDIFISAAAVCDFRPERLKGKISKRKNRPKEIRLIPNPDILKWASRHKEKKLLVGFALEDDYNPQKAKRKMKEKKCDVMVANTKENLAADRKTFFLLTKEGSVLHRNISLEETAGLILEKCVKIKNTF
ncbi:MAG: phosphopantothenoylcysteine decarboxylase [Elusimicrobiota bacterium]